MDEVGNPQGREAGVVATTAGGTSRLITLLVESLGDLGIDMIVE